MTYTSNKARRVATRARRRQRHRIRYVRLHRPSKRVLREQAAANVEECFDDCSDRGFHCDPDVKIGSEADQSWNGFSILEPSWSQTASHTATPLQSSFTFTSANCSNSSSQRSSTSLLLPSTPTTPPLPSIVNLPDNVSNYGPRGVRTPFGISPVPGQLLYQDKSRALPQGIHQSDLSLVNSFAITCGQEAPDPDFESYKVKLIPLIVGDNHAQTDRDAEAALYTGPVVGGAALSDTRKADPGQAINVAHPDVNFYKYTRSYLWQSAKETETPFLHDVTIARDIDRVTPEAKGFSRPVLTTTTTCPKWPWRTTHVVPAPSLHFPPLTPPTTSSLELGEKPGLWKAATTPPVQQLQSVHGLLFPTLEPAAVCRRSPSTPSKSNPIGYVRCMTNFWDSSCDGRPQREDLHSRKMAWRTHHDVIVADVDSSMSAFEEAMSKKPKYPADLTPYDLATHVPVQACHSTAPRLRKSPIRESAIHSVINPSTLSEASQTNAVAAGAFPACTTLVPSTLHEHQYLGWPKLKTEKEILYQDKTWLSLGASMAQLQEELACEGPNLALGSKQDADPNAAVEKTLERVAGNLDVKMGQDEDLPHADAWLQALQGQSNFSGAVSDSGQANPEGARDPTKEYFGHGAVVESDLTLSIFNKSGESPDSGDSWSEIDAENENEDD